MTDISPEDAAIAKRALTACREEALNAAYVILTQRYGFSPKQVERALQETRKELDQWDAETIPLVFSEG